MGVWLTTREDVMSAPDIRASAYATRDIDRAIESASRKVEKLCHRTFHQWTGTRSFPYPNEQHADTGRLWLDQYDLISLSAMTAGGVTVNVSTDVFLEPVNSGPPYRSIEIDRASSAALAMNSGTAQRSITLTGTWGYSTETEPAGTLTTSPSSSSTTVGISTAARVGDILQCGTEWLLVTEKTWATSAQTGTLSSSTTAQTLAVADGTAFAVGEELLLDAERVLVRDIAANNLIVQRAWSGTTLAAHAGATIYYPRTLTVTRGANGSTAAAHTSGNTVVRQVIPGPVRELALAYALDQFFQASSGYARTIGQGESERNFSGRAITQLEETVWSAYGRRPRARAV